MSFYHFLWFLLPLLYLAITVKAFIKRRLKSKALEDEKDYFRHFIFCLVCYFVALLIDQRFGEEYLSQGILSEFGDADVFRWLLYPGVLLLCATVAGHLPFLKSKKAPTAPRSRF